MPQTKDRNVFETLPGTHLMPSKYGVINYRAWCQLECNRLNDTDKGGKKYVVKDTKQGVTVEEIESD